MLPYLDLKINGTVQNWVKYLMKILNNFISKVI